MKSFDCHSSVFNVQVLEPQEPMPTNLTAHNPAPSAPANIIALQLHESPPTSASVTPLDFEVSANKASAADNDHLMHSLRDTGRAITGTVVPDTPLDRESEGYASDARSSDSMGPSSAKWALQIKNSAASAPEPGCQGGQEGDKAAALQHILRTPNAGTVIADTLPEAGSCLNGTMPQGSLRIFTLLA